MSGLELREVFVSLGTSYMWQRVLPYQYWDMYFFAGARHYLINHHTSDHCTYTKSEMEDVRRNQSVMQSVGLKDDPSCFAITYRHWDRDSLVAVVRTREVWMERYTGAAAVLLTLQFIETCMSEMDGMQARELGPFVAQFCYLLQTQSEKALTSADEDPPAVQQMHPAAFLNQVLRLMYEVVANNTDRLVNAAHESVGNLHFYTSLIQPTPTVAVHATALDNLIGDLFCMFNHDHVDNDSILAIWNLVQVLDTPLFPTNLPHIHLVFHIQL